MRSRTLFSAAVLAFATVLAGRALGDSIRADGFDYGDMTVVGLKGGALQTQINGTEKLFDLSKVETINLTGQAHFNDAEAARKDPTKAAALYKQAIQNINDDNLKIVAKLRRIGPADADGKWSDAVADFLDVYAASPTDSVWKLRPTHLPAQGSTMLKESAALIDAKLAGFKSAEAIKNVKTLELDILNKANDPRAAALASELGGGPITSAATAGNAGTAVPALAGSAAKNAGASANPSQSQATISMTPEAAVQFFESKAQALEADHKPAEAAATWMRIPAHYPASGEASNALLHAADLLRSLPPDSNAKIYSIASSGGAAVVTDRTDLALTEHDVEAGRLYQEILDKYPNSGAAVRATTALKAIQKKNYLLPGTKP